MSDGRAHPNALDWAKHLSGEAHGLAGWRFRRHLRSCASCLALEADMVAERTSFDASPLRREEVAFLQGRIAAVPASPAPSAPPRLRWAIAVGIVATVIATVVARAPSPDRRLVEKGGDVFAMSIDRPSGTVDLGPRCAAGDRIIARYRTQRSFLLVLERDGRGVVQVLHPREGTASVRLTAAEGTTPTGWILDAVAGPECFAAFFSDEPVDAASASRAFAASPTSPALPGATVRVLCCDKEP
jgi:hypothetical protein